MVDPQDPNGFWRLREQHRVYDHPTVTVDALSVITSTFLPAEGQFVRILHMDYWAVGDGATELHDTLFRLGQGEDRYRFVRPPVAG